MRRRCWCPSRSAARSSESHSCGCTGRAPGSPSCMLLCCSSLPRIAALLLIAASHCRSAALQAPSPTAFSTHYLLLFTNPALASLPAPAHPFAVTHRTSSSLRPARLPNRNFVECTQEIEPPPFVRRNTSTAAVRITFVASGAVDDYGPGARQEILNALALAARIIAPGSSAPAGSTLQLTAASVKVIATFPVASAAAAEEAMASFSASFSSAGELQQLLGAVVTGMTVETAPTVGRGEVVPSWGKDEDEKGSGGSGGTLEDGSGDSIGSSASGEVGSGGEGGSGSGEGGSGSGSGEGGSGSSGGSGGGGGGYDGRRQLSSEAASGEEGGTVVVVEEDAYLDSSQPAVFNASCLPSFTFYSVEISSVTPYAGPTGGGTRVVVGGLGFDSLGGTDAFSMPHGRNALCRFSASVVNATVTDEGTLLSCVSPPSLEGARSSRLSVSLNGVDFVGLPAVANPRRQAGVGVGATSPYDGSVHYYDGSGSGHRAASHHRVIDDATLFFLYYEEVRLRTISERICTRAHYIIYALGLLRCCLLRCCLLHFRPHA